MSKVDPVIQTAKEKKGLTVRCPQCSGKGWRFGRFMESPKTIWRFLKSAVAYAWESVIPHHCDACDGKKQIPQDWLEGEE